MIITGDKTLVAELSDIARDCGVHRDIEEYDCDLTGVQVANIQVDAFAAGK